MTSLFAHISVGQDLDKGAASQFFCSTCIIWDYYLAAFVWDWLWMECPRRLFSLTRHSSAPLSGHFLSVWVVRVLTQHVGPRVNGFLLHGWLIRGNIPRGEKAKVSCFKSYNFTSVTFCWSQLVTRPAQVHGKRKNKKW